MSNPVVPVCVPPYAQDHAYTHTVTISYITDGPERATKYKPRAHYLTLGGDIV
jgi:hypothetical protein